MNSRRIRLLVIGHDASLTGAPLLLESYLKAACANKSFDQVRIVLGSGGALIQEYFQIADTFVADQASPNPLFGRIASKLAKVLGLHYRHNDSICKWLECSQEPDIIYVNTVASIPLLSRILLLLITKPKIVIHVHELDWLLQKYENEHNISALLCGATEIIAPCNAVALSLNALFKIPLESIHIIPEWVCRDVKIERYDEMRLQVRRELGVEEGDWLCISVGKMQWRKGSDLLPLIASKFAESYSRIHFAWVGSSSNDELIQLKLDLRKAGVDQFVHLIPEKSDPYPYYSAADLFILPSREDPCPVAMLEAGLFRLPVVCFDDSGGAPEYVGNGSGVSVPFLNIAKFACAIQKIFASPKEREKMGHVARSTVLQNHNISTCEQLITRVLLKSC